MKMDAEYQNFRYLYIFLYMYIFDVCVKSKVTSWRPYGSPLVWACQWPSSQPLSSPQLSHNDSLWA